MSTHTAVHITAGRNIGSTPMAEDRWKRFIEVLKQDLTLTLIVMGVFDAPVEVHLGTGSYNGVPEDSVKVSTYFEGLMAPDFQEELSKTLTLTARLFDQESIAFSVGPSNLAFA